MNDLNAEIHRMRRQWSDDKRRWKSRRRPLRDVSTADNADELAVRKELTAMLLELFRCLDARQAAILEMRAAGLTLDEVGKKFGITKERVREVQNQALQKLQHPIRANRLESCVDIKGWEPRLSVDDI